MAKSRFLYDDFSTTIAVSGKWTTTNAVTGVVSGGLMRIKPTTGYDAVEAVSTWDMTGSHIGFKLDQNCARGTGTNTFTSYALIDSNNYMAFWIEGGRTLGQAATVYMQEKVAGVLSDTTFVYDPDVHVWFRMRESSGTIYWETSIDGATWTTRRSKTTTLTLTSVRVILEGGYYGAEAGTTFATIDDFNLWDGVPTTPKMETLTDNFATADTDKWVFGSSAAVTGGQLVLTSTVDNLSDTNSVDIYDLTDSYLSVGLVQNLPAGTHLTRMAAYVDGSNYLRIMFDGQSGYIYFEEMVAGVSSQTALAISPLNHKYFRIRSTGTTITWETSRDSAAWTIQRTKTTTLPLDSMKVLLGNGFYGTATAGATTILDDLNIIAGSTIGELPPSADYLTDAFDTLDPAAWYQWGTSWSVSGGRLQTIPPDEYNGIATADRWNLTDSHFAFQLVQNANAGTTDYGGSITLQFRAENLAGNYYEFMLSGGPNANCILRERVGGVNSDGSFTYNATRDKWFRIRHSGTTVYWETSFDGATWSIKRSKTAAVDITSVTCSFISGYWDALEGDLGTVIIDNFNLLNTARLKEIGWYTGISLPMGAINGGTVQAKTYFQAADWMWTPIPDSPVLDPDSAGIGYWLTGGDTDATNASLPGLSWGWYGNAVVYPNQIKNDTPRYRMRLLSNERFPDWYLDDTIFDPYLIPIPYGTQIPPGTDAHLTVIDPVQGKVFSFWQCWYDPLEDSWSASYGGIADYDGDARDYIGGATAANISRAAGCASIEELQAGEIPHALFVASSITRPGTGWTVPGQEGTGPSPFVYPAQKSDGKNVANAPLQYTVVEGTRLQLNPAIDLSAIPNITPIELVIGKAWQRYGAYVGDSGGGLPGMGAGQIELWQGQDYTPHRYPIEAFLYGWDGTGTPTTYPDVPTPLAALGVGWDYFGLVNIPWRGNVRVLRNWDGS